MGEREARPQRSGPRGPARTALRSGQVTLQALSQQQGALHALPAQRRLPLPCAPVPSALWLWALDSMCVHFIYFCLCVCVHFK